MWPKTSITEKLNINLPVIQAPMAGGVTTPELVAAVSNAGGLGSLGVGYHSPDDIRKLIKQVRELTNKPFAVNLFIPENHSATLDQIERARQAIASCCKELHAKISPIQAPYTPSFDDQIQVLIEEKVPVFSFTFGIPSDDWIRTLQSNDTVLIGTATNLAEAKALEAKKIDIIVAQGSEAGGHRGTFIGKAKDSMFPLSALIKTLLYNIKTPIIAAGGIMNKEHVITALAVGASGIQMGTAFLATPEAGTHPSVKELLLKTEFDETTLTNVFSGKFARGIKNTFITRMQEHENNVLHYPIQNALTQTMRVAAASQNNTNFMSMWVGQHLYLTQGVSAEKLIQELDREIRALFSKK